MKKREKKEVEENHRFIWADGATELRKAIRFTSCGSLSFILLARMTAQVANNLFSIVTLEQEKCDGCD